MNQNYTATGNSLLTIIDNMLKSINNKNKPINESEFGKKLDIITKSIIESRKEFKKDINAIIGKRSASINYNPNTTLCKGSPVNIKKIFNVANGAITLTSAGFPPIMCMDSVILSITKKENNLREKSKKQNENKLREKNKANRRRNILELRRLINGGNSSLTKFGTAKN
jgi:hypothetical protein